MAKLLYLQSSPRDRSKSTKVAQAFMEAYQQSHPDDQVVTVNLFEADIPKFDGFALQAKYSLMHGDEYTPEERRAWDLVEKLIADFKSADKYLLSVPMWNFSIPYRLKQYLDNIIQPGYTFNATEKGYEGLVKNKPMVAVYARGGAYPPDTDAAGLDFQKPYVEMIFGFIGITDVRPVVVEPTLQAGPEEVQKIVEAASEQARQLAKDF